MDCITIVSVGIERGCGNAGGGRSWVFAVRVRGLKKPTIE